VALGADGTLRRGGRFGAIKSPFADVRISRAVEETDEALQGLLD